MTDSDHDPSEKTYRAIGRFMFAFSQLEFALRYYLGEEIGIGLDDQHFSAVVESYDVGVLCTVVTEVFKKSRGEENATQIKELISSFRSLNDIRNRVAHGLWVPSKDGGTVHHVARRSLKSTPSANQAEALEKLADEAFMLKAELERALTTLDI